MRFLSPKVWVGALAALTLCWSASPAKANFTVYMDTMWNPTTPGTINAGQLDFVQSGSDVIVTVNYSAAVGASDYGVLKELYLNYQGVTASSGVGALAGFSATLTGLTPTAPGTAVTGSVSPDNVKADGTGGQYDILLDFTPNGSQLGFGYVATIKLSATGGLNADSFQAFSVGASGSAQNLYVSGHYAGSSLTPGASPYIGGDSIQNIPPINPVPAPGGFVLLASMLPFAWGLRRRLTRKVVAA